MVRLFLVPVLFLLGSFPLLTLGLAVGDMGLRQRLLRGGKSYGPLLLSDSPVIAELMAMMGYDHIVVDHEHSKTDARSGQDMLVAMDAASGFLQRTKQQQTLTEAIVRVPNHDQAYLKKVLDSLRLPAGILVPMIEDAASAEKVVKATRYPLQDSLRDPNAAIGAVTGGTRGCALPFIRASSWNQNPSYLRQAQEDVLVMVQVETMEGVEAIPDIANVPGVDGIFLGPLDLSCSMGKLGQFDDPTVQELISQAEQAVLKSPAFLAGFRSPDRTVKSMFETGYSLVCGKIDLGLLRDAAMEDVRIGKEAMEAVQDETSNDDKRS